MSSFSRKPLPNAHIDSARLKPIVDFLEAPNRFGERLTREFPFLVEEIITQALVPTRTGRTKFAELSPEEKKNIGSLLEARIRDLIEAPKGARDLKILGEDVDVKNTTEKTWMVPSQTYTKKPGEPNEILLLCQYNDAQRTCSLGLIIARLEYLRQGKNQDGKLGISAAGQQNIWWLLKDNALPPDIWAGIDVARFRQLRQSEKGTRRAASFFEQHLGIRIERAIVQSLLFDQKDYMKRLRNNGGARDILDPKGITLRIESVEYKSADGGKRWYSFWIAERK